MIPVFTADLAIHQDRQRDGLRFPPVVVIFFLHDFGERPDVEDTHVDAARCGEAVVSAPHFGVRRRSDP